MSIIYEHWKYIVKHIWFVLRFAICSVAFLGADHRLCRDCRFLRRTFYGKPVTDFSDIYSVWSLIDFDSALKIIYGVCAILTTIVAVELLLAFVEKHMRIGKRTLSGLWEQFFGHVLPVLFTVLLAFAAYELWALILSAMLYAVAAIESGVAVALLSFLVIFIFLAVMVYVVSIFYLWLPCMLMTGFRAVSCAALFLSVGSRRAGKAHLISSDVVCACAAAFSRNFVFADVRRNDFRICVYRRTLPELLRQNGDVLFRDG